MRAMKRMLPGFVLLSLSGCGVESGPLTSPIRADRFASSEWSEPVNLGSIINTTFNEQGPSLSNDELSLYFGSDRPGGFGGFDIWVSRRACTDCPWEAPVNLGPVVNSAFDETGDRKSTRLNSSHLVISYAVFCLKKK